jgi:copper transport protein
LPAALALTAAFSLALLGALAPGIASAHASYVSSTPAAGAVLKSAPSVVTVHFAENVNPTGSDIVVYDARHKSVSTAAAQVSHSDLKTMTVPVTGDGDGTYLVEWHTVSADDGDPDIGAFTFTVNSSAKASATPTAAPGGSGPSGGGTGGAPVWLTVLIGLLGIAAGAGGAYVAMRRAG